MNQVVIRSEGLGKKYLIGHQSESTQYATFRETVGRTAKDILRKANDFVRGRPIIQGDSIEEVWALDDLNFEIYRGEAVGIIGRNGAGKSTLLKILSRITEPSAGRVTIKGQVASLLEVGTGFHPELTGRENIYLNGSILGMTRREIQGKFDEIVAFSEVEKHIDTPVKRYSSGMYVRLAFAVAAHLQPEILLVDEVLAVGDLAFQKKCLGKMKDVTEHGRTVIFVSHQMHAIETLCTRALLIEGGHVRVDGKPPHVISEYVESCSIANSSLELAARTDRSGSGEYRFTKVWFTNADGRQVEGFRTGDQAFIHARVTPVNPRGEHRCVVTLVVQDGTGYRITAMLSELAHQEYVLDGGEMTITFRVDPMQLMAGDYQCNLYLGKWGGNEPVDFVSDAFVLPITPGDFLGVGKPQYSPPDKFLLNYDVSITRAEETPSGAITTSQDQSQ